MPDVLETTLEATRAPLIPIVTTDPFEFFFFFFFTSRDLQPRVEYILVIIDHCTQFAQAYATKNKSAKMVIDKIFNDFALHFGLPEKIHHDMGREFENQLMFQLQKYCGVRGSRTVHTKWSSIEY